MGEKKYRQPMPEHKSEERIKNFNEVPIGYSDETAVKEAGRCLQCKKPFCVDGCPVGVDIPGFIKEIKEENYLNAIKVIKNTNSLPAVCGRVCPQETQCEELCVLGKKGESVAIGHLERFAADYERLREQIPSEIEKKKSGKKIAVIGSGPAGLTVSGELLKQGHEVTIFEGLHSPGGVLVYGIPEFRLPKEIVQYEVDALVKKGVKIIYNRVIGMSETIDDILDQGFDAVFIGSGAGLPLFLDIPGENLQGIYSANEYLTRANLMKAYRFPDYDTPIIRAGRVVVFGGGNVAMDSARTALRLGGEDVFLVYRRSRDEMPAREDEIVHAEDEGIQFMLLTNPLEFLGDNQGRVTGVKCMKMKLGSPDDSGRRRPIPVEGSEFILDIDVAIIAIGNVPNPIIQKTTPGMEVTKRGNIMADPGTMKTSKRGVFAGGDIVSGAATVIEAMGMGRLAAAAIEKFLNGEEW